MKHFTISLLALVIIFEFMPQKPLNPDRRSGGELQQLRSGSINGKVTDLSGAGVAGVMVVLASPAGSTRKTMTDEEGNYRFDNIAPGENYSLRVNAGLGFARLEKVSVKERQTTTAQLQLRSPPPPSPHPTTIPTPLPTPRPSPNPSPAPTVRPTPNSSPTPRPSPTGSPTASPTSLEAMITDEAKKLRDSTILFNPPVEMREQKTEIIEARIAWQDIAAARDQPFQGSGPVQEAPLKVSEVMTVTLVGDHDAFLVQPISEAEQVIAGKPYGESKWHVTPLKSGNQKLTLIAVAKILLAGRGEKPFYDKTLERPIIVRVDRWFTVKNFIANNWQWLWAVIVVPLGGLLWGLRRKRTRKAGFR